MHSYFLQRVVSLFAEVEMCSNEELLTLIEDLQRDAC